MEVEALRRRMEGGTWVGKGDCRGAGGMRLEYGEGWGEVVGGVKGEGGCVG